MYQILEDGLYAPKHVIKYVYNQVLYTYVVSTELLTITLLKLVGQLTDAPPGFCGLW
jgi:hypothetical protein